MLKSQNFKLLTVVCSIAFVILSACGQVPSATPTIKITNTQSPTETLAPTSTPDSFPNATLKVIGEEEIVFDWSKDRCEALDIPDLAARAFRDDQGNVQLISAHYTNWRFIGPDLNTIKHDCTPIMKSVSLEDPSLYSYHQWIASTYTEDGKTIYALVHNEYYGSNTYIPCIGKFVGDPSCWYNAITLAVSTNSGASYHASAEPPGNLVASSLYPFEAGAGPYGFFEPSNIIKGKDGYYYAYMREHFPNGGNRASVCIMRTNDLSDASSWRAWDGKDFTISFINPYLKPEEAKSAQECTSIPPNNLGVMNTSVTFNTYLNRYVMVGDTAIHIDGQEVWGILYSFSDDLIHWQPRKLLFEVELPWTYQSGDPDYYHYPSLLDPTSPSRNFDVTGKYAYLYLTRYNKNTSSDPLNRNLVRIPVEFFPSEGGIAWEFESEGNTEGWSGLNQLASLQVINGLLITQSSNVDPYMGSSMFNVDAARSPIIKINMKVSSGDWAQIFFTTTTNSGFDETKSLRFKIQSDGEFHEYMLDMSKVLSWKGVISQIRLDPVETKATIEVDYIRIEGP